MFVGLRIPTTTYLYDDPDHPDRVTGSIGSPAYTPEDQALLIALRAHDNTRCRCGEPVDVAWNPEMDGWYEATEHQCHACTARNGGKPVNYTTVTNTRPASKGPLPSPPPAAN